MGTKHRKRKERCKVCHTVLRYYVSSVPKGESYVCIRTPYCPICNPPRKKVQEESNGDAVKKYIPFMAMAMEEKE